MKKKGIIGIDLGTSNSEVSRLAESGAAELISNLDGDLKTRSIVAWGSGKPIVGKAACPDLAFDPQYVLQCGKRSMGKATDDGKPIPIGIAPDGTEITPVDFSAAILRYLKESAEVFLGCSIDCAVVTVPAYFDTTARDNTISAAKIAGFKRVKLLNEPEAAAVFDGLEKAKDETVVVVDTGGGTTDVSAVEIHGSSVKAILTDGDAELGGSNYDEAILQWIVKEAKKKGITIAPEKDLANHYVHLDRAREGKEMLSRREEVTIIAEADGQRVPLKLTRKILRKVGKAFDDRFVECCQRVKDGLQAQNRSVDRTLLVGGNSRQAHIAELTKQVFGLQPSRDADPDFVVAKGAAIKAELSFGEEGQEIVIGGHRFLAGDIRMQTVAAHPFCVAARRGKEDPKEYNCVIVPAGTSLPHDFAERFSPMNPGQREVLVKIVQGQPNQPSENASVLREICVPIQPSDKDHERIRVQGRYTEEGLLELTVVDELLNKPVADSFVHKPGLSQSEIDEKRQRLDDQRGGE